MQKKNTLYTVNRWNKPLFAQGVDREKNILAFGSVEASPAVAAADRLASQQWGASYGDAGHTLNDYMNSKNAFGLSKADNPFSKMNLQGGLGSMLKTPVAGAALTTFAPMVGNALGSAFSGGRTSAAGSTVSSLGSMAGGVVGQFNPALGAAISAGSGVLGGLVNNLFGMSTNEELLKAANESIDANKNYTSNAASFDDVKDDIASMTSTDVYSGGLFSSGKAARKNRELRERMERAYDWAVRSQDNNLDNLVDDQVNLGLANYASYGGYLDNDYNVAGDYLTMNRKGNKQSNMNNLFVNTPSNMFDLGGVVQMHGGDFSTGISHIDAGGSHEENPNDGVQVGVDSEGTPNLVEEGETIYNQYVFSKRILADEATKKMFKLPRKKDISFAEISKKLEKEITERPNDAISKAGFKAQMQQLEEQQERQKQEMEAARAREAFEALSPEEQTAIMQQAAQQEAMAQQAVENQAIAEQQPEYQPSPEEVAAMQQQADGSEANLGQAVPEMAEGGRINRFDLGGELKKLIYSMLPDVHTDKDFEEFAKKNNLDASSINWEKALENEALKTAISKDNPALKDALSRGYDFGVFKPSSNNTSTYDWANFWTPVNEYSKQKGNADNKYRIDDSYKGNVKELEGKDEYKAFTDYILNNASDEERLNYFKWIDDNTGRSNKYIKDGKLRNDWKTAYEDARNDGLYGIQHYTPSMISSARSAQTKNYVIDENGNVEEVFTDVPKEWTSAGKYSWATPENDITSNYYRRPSDPASKGTPASTGDEREIEPVINPTWMRYAGLFGPAVGLGMQIAGVGKPDYSRLDAAARSANNVSLADYQPIGDYLRFRPMDIWAEQNQLNAQSRATDRALRNTTGPSRTAGIIANGYNSQLASGDLYRKSLEYNDAQRQKVADFNRGTNMFNAEAYNRTSQFNADARNRNRQASASLAMSAARDRLNGDASWYNGIYGNIGQIFKGISDLGRENRETNWRNALVTSGAFGAMDSDALVDARIARYKSKAKGGKIKKGKKGLTF